MGIVVENLKKDFKIVKRENGTFNAIKNFFVPQHQIIHAVKDISFTINDGSIIGFIGKNGAGKSTTIKMLTGIMYPTSGKVLLNGIEPYEAKQEIAKDIGVVFGQRSQLWWDIPVLDSLELYKKMYHVSDKDYKNRLDLFIDLFKMENHIKNPVRQLSLGQRMCADLAAAMIHNPKYMFLDEPTIGLDLINKENMRNFIKTINEEFHTTIVLTSHDLEDIEYLSQNIIIIDKGQLIFNATTDELKRKFGLQKEISFVCKTINEHFIHSFHHEGIVQINSNKSVSKNILSIAYNPDYLSMVKIVSDVLKNCEVIEMSLSEFKLEDAIKKIYTDAVS